MELIFAVLMILVFGKILIFAIRAAWGLTRIFFTIIFLPLAIIGIFISGFMSIAFILLIIMAIVSFFFH